MPKRDTSFNSEEWLLQVLTIKSGKAQAKLKEGNKQIQSSFWVKKEQV